MPKHKFKLGQNVEYMPDSQAHPPLGTYKILRLLPATGNVQQYRVKNASESFERNAQESQLTPAASIWSPP